MKRKITVVIEMEYEGDSAPFPVGTVEHLNRYCEDGLRGMTEGLAGFYQVMSSEMRATVAAATIRPLPEGGTEQ